VNNQQILYRSAKSAKWMTDIEGWVDSNGRFWGENEHMARWSGCTHIDCAECGKPTPVSGPTICGECKDKKELEKYRSMPRMRWDGKTPLYSATNDKYFFDEDDLLDYIEEEGGTVDDLKLIICEPNKFPEIEGDYFYDELPEDGVLPTEIEIAIDAMNKVIRAQPPASWSPGKYAVNLDSQYPICESA